MNIIFDLGGVIIDLKRDNAVVALKKLGLEDANDLLGVYRQDGPFLALEKGTLPAGEFFDRIRGMIVAAGGAEVTDTQLTEAFDEFLVEIPLDRLALLRLLRERGHKLYVLSNTNPIMFNGWIAEAFKQEGKTINDYFDGVVVSFAEGMCKPNPDLFRVPLSRYGLDPKCTIMLDDSEENCEAARSVGMRAERIGTDSTSDLMAVIKRIGVL